MGKFSITVKKTNRCKGKRSDQGDLKSTEYQSKWREGKITDGGGSNLKTNGFSTRTTSAEHKTPGAEDPGHSRGQGSKGSCVCTTLNFQRSSKHGPCREHTAWVQILPLHSLCTLNPGSRQGSLRRAFLRTNELMPCNKQFS